MSKIVDIDKELCNSYKGHRTSLDVSFSATLHIQKSEFQKLSPEVVQSSATLRQKF